MQKIVEIVQGVARQPQFRMAQPVDFLLAQGEHIAITGPNGSGKSILADMVRGAIPLERDEARYDFGPDASPRASDNIRYIAFRDVFGEAEPAYYQQRWNRWDDTPYPTVAEALESHREKALRHASPAAAAQPESATDFLSRLTGSDPDFCRKRINLLSSGELRKFHIAKALAVRPSLLLIDNPFIGLDADARRMLTDLLTALACQLTIIVIVSRREDIPAFITHVVEVDRRHVMPKRTLAEYLAEEPERPAPLSETERESIATLSESQATPESDSMIDFRNIHIGYDGHTILDSLNWTVRKGEHWALQGENGAGKSTLLSLVCADNPMAYACDIRLFGRKRGAGESIWDIKKHIGYVSPEIYQTYRKSLPAIDIVASGLHDTVGLYRSTTAEEKALCRRWLEIFRATELADRNYLQLSSGEQRLVLLVRAFVKSPALMVLDEPYHGLDANRRTLARDIIDTYSRLPGKTLIMVSHYEEELPPCIDHRLRLKKLRPGTSGHSLQQEP